MKITVDESKCMGCRTCELLCSFQMEKHFNPEQSLIKVSFDDDGGIHLEIPPMCDSNDCASEPFCARFCPTGAIQKMETSA